MLRGTSDAVTGLMFHLVTQRFIARMFTAAPLLLLACGSAETSEDVGEPVDTVAEGVGRTIDSSPCETVTAADGWVNTFIPQSTGSFSATFRANPAGNAISVDFVMGLSNGPADAFTDLGPIVRFYTNGAVEVRDRGQYVNRFPYDVGEAPFEFTMNVSIPTHTYDVWVRRLDPPDEPAFLLGENLGFRTEQNNVTRLDNIGRFMNGSEGRVQTCGFQYSAPDACTVSQTSSWASRNFPAQSGLIRIEFLATASSGAIDAVIGASNGAPTAFSRLAPIVRFRPDGTFDARNGSAYAAVAPVPYAANVAYKFALDIDTPNRRYSAMVRLANPTTPENPYVVFAQNFAFRTEQAQVTSLNYLGQFVDGSGAPGSVNVCNLTVAY